MSGAAPTVATLTALLLTKNSSVVTEILRVLDRLAELPQEQLRIQQLAQLGGVFALAKSTSWGKKKYRSYSAVSSWEAWAELPLTTRHELQSAKGSVELTQVPAAFRKTGTSSTSGSTGQPLSSPNSWACGAMAKSVQLQFQRWHQFDFSACTAYLTTPGDQECSAIPGRSWSVPIGQGPGVHGSLSASSSKQLAFIAKVAPRYLATYPSNLQALLKESNGRCPSPGLKYVVLSSEPISEDLVEYCAAAWGVKVLKTYSSNELGPIALEASDGEYAVISPSVYLEILDDDNRPCPAGVTGRVVVSTLQDLLRPLVRYETGDYAEWSPASTLVGPQFPRIRRIAGRQRAMVTLGDGRRVWPYFELAPLLGFTELLCWQLVQKRDSHLEIRVVTENAVEISESLHQAIAQTVRTALPGLNISIRRVDDIPRAPSGKFIEFFSELDGSL